ncbi:MAG: sugar ABC transporter substrate-binding protein [Candidatus Sericytochromatia bacterium]|nr:sugar ABC transporter substrate-binding protein [Candidatus Tanganyikabacteria bacterium]
MPRPARSRALLALTSLMAAVLVACAPAHSTALRFSTWGSLDEIATLRPILEAFTRKEGVPVELIHIPDEYAHKLRLMVVGGTVPDVMFMSNEALPGFARKGVLADLALRLAKDGQLRERDFFPQVLDAMRWKGTLHGLPRDLSNLVVFYNKDLFDEAGVPYPKPGWTMADLQRIAPKLTVPGKRWAIGFQPNPLIWTPWVWSHGGDIVDASMTRCTLGDPAAREGLQVYLDLRHRQHVAPSDKDTGNARMTQLFATGKLAMFVYGRWAVPGYRRKIKFNWDVTTFPAGPAGSVVDTDASGWAMSARTRQPEAAWKLIRHLASRESIEAFTRSGLIVPSRPDVAYGPAFLSGSPAGSRVFLDVIAKGRPTRVPPAYDEITWELIDGLGPMWTGEESLDEALPPVIKRVDALLAEVR